MTSNPLENLRLRVPRAFRIKIYADGADKTAILRRYQDPQIAGFTTNPTLMRKSGVSDYEQFGADVLSVVTEKPISFEVFSDELPEMGAQARAIASWGANVLVKVPITNTKGQPTEPIIAKLAQEGVRLNVTALTTFEQVRSVAPLLAAGQGGIISVFAGRIADSGRDPVPVMERCGEYLQDFPKVELLWASPRELLNLVQAEDSGCHLITLTEDLLQKLPLLGGNLEEVSLNTVKMFYDDAQAAGYKIRIQAAVEK
jgi:transaldolase